MATQVNFACLPRHTGLSRRLSNNCIATQGDSLVGDRVDSKVSSRKQCRLGNKHKRGLKLLKVSNVIEMKSETSGEIPEYGDILDVEAVDLELSDLSMAKSNKNKNTWVNILSMLATGASQVVEATVESTMTLSTKAIRGLVGGVMSDVCGEKVSILGEVKLTGNGILLLDMRVGKNLSVETVFLQAQLEPLLAVLRSWQSTPEGTQAPPILLEAIVVRGVTCCAVEASGIMKAFGMFLAAPGAISVGVLSLGNVNAEIAYHDADTGAALDQAPTITTVKDGVWTGSFEAADASTSGEGGESRESRHVCIKRMEFRGLESRMDLSQMATTISCYSEEEVDDGPLTQTPPEPTPELTLETYPEDTENRSLMLLKNRARDSPEEGKGRMARLGQRGMNFLKSAQSKGLENALPNTVAAWVPPAVANRVNRTLQTTALENLGPVVQAQVVSQVASLVNIADAGVDTWRAAAGTDLAIDAGLILALLSQGLPKWFLTRKGGKLLVRMVETGVAAELLKQGDLIQLMVEKRLLERMLELNLLEKVLDRGDLTKQLIRQGILRDMMELGVVEAMISSKNAQVLTPLIGGDILDAMVCTNLMCAIKVLSK